ncbi:MAG: acetylxylan esterase, partial [Treponema sp.]|nr:acetylxylan esterase [Treponema sp.]
TVAILAITVILLGCTSVKEKEAGGYSESKIMIDGVDHQIPAVVTLPGGKGPFPAVVMLHGYGSNKDEAGNGYMLLAPEFAKNGIASIRIDFMGYGDSTEDHAGFDLNIGVTEALKAADYIAGLSEVDGKRIGIMGWSKGGTLALLTSGRDSRFKSVLTWAGAPDLSGVYSSEGYAQAKENGNYVADLGWRPPFNMSLKAFEVFASTDILAEFAHCGAPVLAINGTDDTVVSPATAARIKDASANSASKSLLIDGADHTFNIFTEDKTAFNTLCQATIKWFKDTL